MPVACSSLQVWTHALESGSQPHEDEVRCIRAGKALVLFSVFVLDTSFVGSGELRLGVWKLLKIVRPLLRTPDGETFIYFPPVNPQKDYPSWSKEM